MNIKWRERLLAAAIHFLITLAITGIAAAIIFFVWFPGSFAEMVGGTKLFLIVVGCDASLGPLVSLVIYSRDKSRKQLVADYSVVGIVQLATLLYGVYVVALSRPVFIAFDVDQLEVVTAIELDEADLALGVAPEFRAKSWTGPRLVAIERPIGIEERNDLLMTEVMAGKRASTMPKYYRPYETAREKVIGKSRELAAFPNGDAARKAEVDKAVLQTKQPANELRWLSVRHRFGFAMVLVHKESGLPIRYLKVDPN